MRNTAIIAVLVFAPLPAWSQTEFFLETAVWFSSPKNDTASIALGDVDGDGDLDLVCGNVDQPNTLYWNEDGVFATNPAWFSEPENSTQAVALGDVDGDGDLDLVCGNQGQPNTLYLNDGSVFQRVPAWSSNLAAQTRSVALGDVDGDGYLDVVCGNIGQWNVLYQNGGGQLQASPAWLSLRTSMTTSVALGDIDQDGDLDLVCGNYEEPNMAYRNEGGVFETTNSWSSDAVAKTNGIALGDVDGDGALDLACANHDQANTLHRSEAGSLQTAPTWTSDTANLTHGVAMGDVDGDGDLDLVFGNGELFLDWQPNTLFVNEGGEIQTAPAFSSFPLQTASVALGDVDGDGDLDLACGNLGRNFQGAVANTLYRNVGANFSTLPAWTSSLSDFSIDLAVGDVDGDADLDAVFSEGIIKRLHLNDAGVLESTAVWSSTASSFAQGTALGDVDGDGDLDLICGNSEGPSRGQNTLYLNEGGVFLDPPAWRSGPSSATWSVDLGDVDGDGDLDLVCGNGDQGNALYLNDRGMFAVSPAWWSETVYGTFGVDLGDIDGDGDLDLVCGNDEQPNTLYLNDGGVFEPNPAWSSDLVFETGPVALGDIDGDGDLDLVCGNGGQSNTVYLNDAGMLRTSPVWLSDPANNTSAISLGDVDGDGDLDLVCGNGEGESNTLYLNEGGMFQTTPSFAFGSTVGITAGIALEDMDGDGDLDIVCANLRRPGLGERNTLYANLRSPPYKGDLENPTNQLANNAAFLKSVTLEPTPTNLSRVRFTAHDAESDPVRVIADYQFEGAAQWFPIDIHGSVNDLGILSASPLGDAHEFLWDLSRFRVNGPHVVLRLRSISNPTQAGAIRHVATYNKAIGAPSVRRPQIAVSAAQLFFPTVTVGDTVSVSLEILNDGNETLTVTGIDLPSSEIRATPRAFVLEPDEKTALTLFLEPQLETRISGAVRILGNDPESPDLEIPVEADIRSLRFQSRLLSDDDPVPGGRPLIVAITLPDPEVRVERATIYFRRQFRTSESEEAFSEVAMVPAAGDSSAFFAGTIPGESVTEAGLEYFVEVENSGIFNSDPPGAPVALFTQDVEAPRVLMVTAEPAEGVTFLTEKEIVVKVRVPDWAIFEAGTVHYRRGGESTYQTRQLAAVDMSLAETSIPAAATGPRGVEYWVDVQTRTLRLTDPSVDPSQHPRTIQITVGDLVEPATHRGEAWRMLSIPLFFTSDFTGTLEALVADQPEFGAYDVNSWRSFRYMPLTGAYVELPQESTRQEFRPEPGRGFWLITKNDHRVGTAPISGVSTPTDVPYPIDLQPGWNQIGNPYGFPVAWDSVVVDTAAVDPPFAFDEAKGHYQLDPPTALLPFTGYFIKNFSSQVQTLLIPSVEADSPPHPGRVPSKALPEAAARPSIATPPGAWRIRLFARVDNLQDSVELGVHPEGRNQHDALDREKPPVPPAGDAVRLAVVNRDWNWRAGPYGRDLRASEGEGHTWRLEMSGAAVGEKVVLRGWAVENLPAELALRLVDLEQSVSVDLRATDRYVVISPGPRHVYRLILLSGAESYVAHEGERLIAVPRALSLDQNVPNPFNPATRIRFGLPQASRVTLQVYNARGKRLRNLMVAEQRPAGYHTVIWDGKDESGGHVSSGIFFYRLLANQKRLTRKMVVLR